MIVVRNILVHAPIDTRNEGVCGRPPIVNSVLADILNGGMIAVHFIVPGRPRAAEICRGKLRERYIFLWTLQRAIGTCRQSGRWG